MSKQNQSPFANSDAFQMKFAPEDEEEEVVEVVKQEEEEKPKDPTKKGDREIEDVLDVDVAALNFVNDDGEDLSPEELAQKVIEEEDEDFDYTALAKKNVKAGIWEDYKDSDTLELDKETFKQLVKLQEDNKKKQIKDAFLDAQDPDEKEYFEYKKNGGNIDLYLQARQRSKAVDSIDITTDQGKLNAVHTYYKHIVGWDDAKIEKHIQKAVESLEIDDEADYAKGKLDKMVADEKQKLIEDQKAAAKVREEQFNAYKTSLKDVMKEKGLDTTKIKKITESFVNQDKTNGLTEIDKTFIAHKSDPKLAIDLYNYLTDPDKFIAEASKKLADRETKKTFLELKQANKSSGEKEVVKQQKKKIELFS